METVKIKIKESSNKLAWSNRNVGKIVIATKERFFLNGRMLYSVKREDNPHIYVDPNFISGFVELEDADEV